MSQSFLVLNYFLPKIVNIQFRLLSLACRICRYGGVAPPFTYLAQLYTQLPAQLSILPCLTNVIDQLGFDLQCDAVARSLGIKEWDWPCKGLHLQLMIRYVEQG